MSGSDDRLAEALALADARHSRRRARARLWYDAADRVFFVALGLVTLFVLSLALRVIASQLG